MLHQIFTVVQLQVRYLDSESLQTSVSSSIKHIIHNASFDCFPIHISAASIDTLVRCDAYIGEKRYQISDAVDLPQ
jgi:hypothetical protein